MTHSSHRARRAASARIAAHLARIEAAGARLHGRGTPLHDGPAWRAKVAAATASLSASTSPETMKDADDVLTAVLHALSRDPAASD